MRKFLLLFLMTGAAMAQSATTTTYTGTLTDLAQQPITSGQVTFTLTPSTDSTLPGTGRFIPSTINCNINSDGTLSGIVAGAVSGACLVTRNTAISPGGTAYRICIQPNYSTPGSCWYDYATTATKDISTPAPTLSTGPLNYNGVPGPPGCVNTGCNGVIVTAPTGAQSAANFASTFYVGTSPNTNIQTTITNAGTTGNVIIPSTYAGTDAYTNPNSINITDLRTLQNGAPFTNRSFSTPLQYINLTDNSVKNTSGAEGDPFVTPVQLININDTSANDAAPAYWNHFCNYTGGAAPNSGDVGPCLGSIISVGDSAADTHYGVWGQNTIVQTNATNSLVNMFGYELNQFNLTGADSNLTTVNTFTRGPYYGFVATAAGDAEQVAAFVVDDESNIAGNAGSGWHNGLFVNKADNAAVLCGAPNFASTVPTCISHSALGTATASVNYSSTPDLQAANVWSGGTHAVSRGFTNQLIPGTGSDPITCETWIFDGSNGLQGCSNGELLTHSLSVGTHTPIIGIETGGGALTAGTASFTFTTAFSTTPICSIEVSASSAPGTTTVPTAWVASQSMTAITINASSTSVPIAVQFVCVSK